MKDLQPIIEKRIEELKIREGTIMTHINNYNDFNRHSIIDYGKKLQRILDQISELELIMNTLNQ